MAILRDLKYKIAYEGFSPIQYSNTVLFSENYKKDFPSGVENYKHSLIPKILCFLEDKIKLKTLTSIQFLVFFQVAIFIFGLKSLCKSIKCSDDSTDVILVLSLFSCAMGLNLARFGDGFGSLLQFPLFYGCSLGLGFLGISFLVKNKLVLGALCNILNFFIHPIFALIFFLSTASFLIKNTKSWKTYFTFCISVLIIKYISFKEKNTFEKIEFNNWATMTKYFGDHWYPFERKLFTNSALPEFLPYLGILLIGTLLLSETKYFKEDSRKNIMRSILTSCFFITVAGIVFSLSSSFTLIQLNLLRASGLISFVIIILFTDFLFSSHLKSHLRFINGWFLTSFVTFVPGFPLIGIIPISTFIAAKKSISNNKKALFICIILTLFIISFLLQIRNLLSCSSYFDLIFFGGLKKENISIIKIIIIYLCFYFLLSKHNFNVRKKVCLLIITYLSSSSLLLSDSTKLLYKNFYETQLWAEKNTKAESCFLVDPSIYYGWRDFSNRSSFGNLREWGYSSFAYNLSKSAYIEGIKRMRAIGLKVYSGIAFEDLLQTNMNVEKIFYEMDESKLINLCTENNLQYIVVRNTKFRARTDSIVNVFSNTSFSIYEIK